MVSDEAPNASPFIEYQEQRRYCREARCGEGVGWSMIDSMDSVIDRLLHGPDGAITFPHDPAALDVFLARLHDQAAAECEGSA